jgi:hypothetical protein
MPGPARVSSDPAIPRHAWQGLVVGTNLGTVKWARCSHSQRPSSADRSGPSCPALRGADGGGHSLQPALRHCFRTGGHNTKLGPVGTGISPREGHSDSWDASFPHRLPPFDGFRRRVPGPSTIGGRCGPECCSSGKKKNSCPMENFSRRGSTCSLRLHNV